MKLIKKLFKIFTACTLVLASSACSSKQTQTVEKNGSVVILYTSDIHCGINEGFGFEGLQQIREGYEAKGYTTLLVDDGDAIQGETVGTFTQGEAIIQLMNAVHYDVAIPGNHEFDYGMDRFMELAEKAEFPYISCNFNKNGESVFAPYIIKEVEGMKIAFIGITTPTTITSSTPKYFQNEKGEFIYDFLQGDDGTKVYDAVQKAVDDARNEGADYVYVMGHIGMDDDDSPWTYADIISHTNGIDVFLDGHSHDTNQIVMKNKDGEDVIRSAVGTKFNCIGFSIITPEDGIKETNILTWTNKTSAPELFHLNNSVTPVVKQIEDDLDKQLSEVIGKTDASLLINDPVQKDSSGNAVRIVRTQETNLGDLTSDALRYVAGADIAFVNGGGIRTGIDAGDITYGDVLNVMPFGNYICVREATGQQILDTLEWTSRSLPGENGGFLHPSGLTYEIDVSIPSSCTADENGMFVSVEGQRRVKNVMVNGEPIDPEKTYTVAGADFLLLNHGSGITTFDGTKILQKKTMQDVQTVITYITEKLEGKIGEEYSNPYGQHRITILNGE